MTYHCNIGTRQTEKQAAEGRSACREATQKKASACIEEQKKAFQEWYQANKMDLIAETDMERVALRAFVAGAIATTKQAIELLQ